ncbi:MAG TPA: alpha/beta hydrolase [Bacteroidales bacterium]|nr:alpha/beta hydrolase [Bacteroidales bacterium]
MRNVIAKVIISFVFSYACITACQPYDQVETIDPKFFIEVTNQVDLTFQEMLQAFGKELEEIEMSEEIVTLAEKLFGDHVVTAYVINYNTIDPLGNRAVASGTIYYPKNFKIKGVVEVAPIAYLQKTSGASDRIPATEALQSMMGYLTIIPDFLGYGVSKDTHYCTFLNVDNVGIVGYHMREASREFLRTLGYKLPEHTLLAGYSLGGSSAMAMLRYYELHGERVTVEKASLGCGCYDPRTAFDVYARTGYCAYTVIPTVIYAMDKYEHLNLDYTKVFTGDLLKYYPQWLDRSPEHGAGTLNENLTSDIRTYLHPDFFTEEKNAEFHKIYKVLKQYSHVDGWTPKTPVYIYHAQDDEIVPFECAEYAYAEFKKRNAPVSFYSGNGGHVGYASKMFIAMYLYLIAK